MLSPLPPKPLEIHTIGNNSYSLFSNLHMALQLFIMIQLHLLASFLGPSAYPRAKALLSFALKRQDVFITSNLAPSICSISSRISY